MKETEGERGRERKREEERGGEGGRERQRQKDCVPRLTRNPAPETFSFMSSEFISVQL